MSNNQAGLFKLAIWAHLQNLVNNGILEKVYESDLLNDSLETKYSGDPIALLGINTTFTSDRDTTTSNMNDYAYLIMVKCKIANFQANNNVITTTAEDLRDDVITEFNQDTTYGLANGWVDPVKQIGNIAQDTDKGQAVFILQITAHIASDLTTIS